jgi:uncharacterized protein YdhG (YjbR/CyaY superfamily)
MGRDRKNLAATVEEYLTDTPVAERKALERVRKIVLNVVPEATEKIAYRIIVLAHHGDLVGLASQPRHLSLYTMSPGLVASMAERLKPFKVSGATIHFTADDPLPADLIEEMVRKRLDENLARGNKG